MDAKREEAEKREEGEGDQLLSWRRAGENVICSERWWQ